MLEIRNLYASVDGNEILKGINLTINPGEVHAIRLGLTHQRCDDPGAHLIHAARIRLEPAAGAQREQRQQYDETWHAHLLLG